MKSECLDENINSINQPTSTQRKFQKGYRKRKCSIQRTENSDVYHDRISVKPKVSSVKLRLTGPRSCQVRRYDDTKKSYFGKKPVWDKSRVKLPEDTDDCIYGEPEFLVIGGGLWLSRKKPSYKPLRYLWLLGDSLENIVLHARERKSADFKNYGIVITAKNDTCDVEYFVHRHTFLIENGRVGHDIYALEKGKYILPEHRYLQRMRTFYHFPHANCNINFYIHPSTESNSFLYPTHAIIDLYYRRWGSADAWVPVVDKKRQRIRLEVPLT